MKTISHFVFGGFVLMLFAALMVSPSQAQNESGLAEVIRGTGTVTGSNPNWIFFPIDLTKYSSGVLYVSVSAEPGKGISRTSGKCWGRLQLSEEGFFDPNNKILHLQPGQGGRLTKVFRKPTKFILGVISKCKPELSNKFQYIVYVKNGKKINANDEHCSECRDRYYIRFSGKESLTLKSLTGHAFVTWIKLDKTNKQTIQSFGVYKNDGVAGFLFGGFQQVRSEPQNSGDTNMLIEVSESDFNRSLKVLKGYKNSKVTYDLLTNNCVGFVHNIASLIGISDSEQQSCPSDKIVSPLKLPSSPMFTIPNLYIKDLLKLNNKRITSLKYCNN